MADIKFSEFPKANQSKDTDELAILQDGVNKMIQSPVLESKIINKTVSRVIEQGGASLNVINLKGVVPTYADLATITPTPELNDAYQVEADGLVYVYTENGFQADGDGFVVQAEPNGVVEEGNAQAVSGGEVYKVINPFTVRNNQLFDNSTMLTGSYTNTGFYNDGNVNWICTPLIPLDSDKTDITLSGGGNIPAAGVLFCFFDENSQFISYVSPVSPSTTPQTSEIPVGAYFVAVNVANAVGIGLDPTNSPYATTFMLNYGSEALPWEEYGLIIDGTQIIGAQPELQENIDNLENLKEKFENVTVPSDQLFDNSTMLKGYYTNTGFYNDSMVNWICTPLIPLDSDKTDITVSGGGNIPASSVLFCFFNQEREFISYVSSVSPSTTPQTSEIPVGAYFVAVNVANVVDIGLDPTNSPYATTFMLNYGSEALPWEEYGFKGSYLDGTKIKGLVLPETGNPMQFISYNAATKSFKHYQRDANSKDVYYMFEVRLNSSEGTPTDPIVYRHLWEVTSAKKCIYNSVSNQMTEQLNLIVSGESEFVFMCEGIVGNKVDHTGGIHGDERIDKDPSSFIWPFIDGKKVADLNTDIALKSCSSFSYAQRSTLHETAERIDGVATGLQAIGAGVLTVNTSTRNFEIDGNNTGVVAYSQSGFLNAPDSNQTVTDVGGNWVINRVTQIVAGHPIMGEHFKITYFENQGYRTINTLVTTAQYEPRIIKYWYHGIYCLHKNAATFGFNEEFIEATFTGSLDIEVLKTPKNRFFKAYNPSTGLSAEVTSRIIVESTNCKDGDTEMFIWDREADSKYYRQTGSFLPITGEKQTSEMTVKYNYKQ